MNTDLQTQSAAPLVFRGKTYAPLTMGDYGLLANAMHEHRKALAEEQIKILSSHGVKPMQLPLVLQSLAERPAFVEVRRWLYTSDGAEAVLRMRDVPMDGDPYELHEFALRLAGIELPGADEESEADDDALPLSSGPVTETG